MLTRHQVDNGSLSPYSLRNLLLSWLLVLPTAAQPAALYLPTKHHLNAPTIILWMSGVLWWVMGLMGEACESLQETIWGFYEEVERRGREPAVRMVVSGQIVGFKAMLLPKPPTLHFSLFPIPFPGRILAQQLWCIGGLLISSHVIRSADHLRSCVAVRCHLPLLQ